MKPMATQRTNSSKHAVEKRRALWRRWSDFICRTFSRDRIKAGAVILILIIGSPLTSFPQTPTPYPSAPPAYPLKPSVNQRYLVDQNNVPFLMVGFDAQGLIGRLSHSESDIFFSNRKAAGFNTFWIDVLCYRCTGNGNTIDGIPPFTTPGDISTPNEAYFARVEDRVQLAAQYGLNLILNPAETIGSLQRG